MDEAIPRGLSGEITAGGGGEKLSLVSVTLLERLCHRALSNV